MRLRRIAPLVLLAPPLGAGCPPEYNPAPQPRVLTSDPLLDAGSLPVGERATLGLLLRSEGTAPVTVDAIEVEGDVEAFALLEWADQDGVLPLPSGSPEAPATAELQVSYRPPAAGAHRAVLAIHSDDTEVEGGIWRVALRGLAQHPCAALDRILLDFGAAGAGSYQSETVRVYNCGQVGLTLAGFDEGGSTTFSVMTADPLAVEVGGSAAVELAWAPADTEADAAEIAFLTSDPERALVLGAFGNDCAASLHPDWDQDGDGWTVCGGDCDDADATVSPSEAERENATDDDCDGAVDEAANQAWTDEDGDGVTEEQGDCDDADPSVAPGAEEHEDARDEDCDGEVDEGTARSDDDGDGLSEREGDCDDGDAATRPGAAELPDDGVDNDCDGQVDEGGAAFDDDGDGVTEEQGDCDDGNPWAFPGSPEDCDGVDQDCDGAVDEDEACSYLAERSPDSGEGEPAGCGSAGASLGPRGALIAALALLGSRRRRYSALESQTPTRPA